MTTRVHKLDATSPLIQYAGPWTLQINEKYVDPFLCKNNSQLGSCDTYASCDHNCSATLQFTGIQVLVAAQCDGNMHWHHGCNYA